MHSPTISRVAATVMVALAACGSLTDLGTGGGGGGGVVIPPVNSLPDSVVQVVTITPEVPLEGGDIIVRSVLRNERSTGLQVTTRVCGLSWGGTIRVGNTPGSGQCNAWSQASVLAPGDSIVQTASWRLLSPAGNYTLYVGHLLAPSAYVHALPIVVQ